MDFHGAEMYEITCCRDCHNAIIDLAQIEKACRGLLQEHDFSARQRRHLGGVKAKYHDIFKIAIAGCPNSCSQPQVKDFGLQGQSVPEVGEGCTGCGLCVTVCPDNSIVINEDGPQIDRSLCLNCGQCARRCPTGAIHTGQGGYRVIWGGKLGRRPMLAKDVCLLTDEQGAVRYLQQAIELLCKEGQPGERFGALLERMKQKNEKKTSTHV